MAKRSLQASVDGIRKARQAFKRKGWTQEYLASEVGLETRQPIWKFFSGKPVDRQVFHEICFVLELEPEEIRLERPAENGDIATDNREGETTSAVGHGQEQNLIENTIEQLDVKVQKVRSSLVEKIQHQCGWLRILDIARPLNLDELYVDVTMVEEVSSHRWLNPANLQPEESQGWGRLKIRKNQPLTSLQRSDGRKSPVDPGHRSSPLKTASSLSIAQVNGIEAIANYPRLMLLGKPGAGKTTFLQAIALKSNHGGLKSDCVPIFISLKRFAESSTPSELLEFITREFGESGLTSNDWHNLFICGRGLILLDGLDEVVENANDWVVREIRNFSDRYYKTQIILSCRVAAQLYQFSDFTAVQIADLTPPRILHFAQKWFYAVGKLSPHDASQKAEQFIQKLELPENYPIRELATTPILLNLMCLVFNSLGDFPRDRAQLYKQGLDLLLVRWDKSRGIKRIETNIQEQAYQNLSLQDKIKILGRIAAFTFRNGDYFFSENQIKHIIGAAIQEIKGASIEANYLELRCQTIIKSIESQHGLLLEQARGIYSFSHLTFQEYFTAWEIALNADSQSLASIVTHLWEPRWREVFLLISGILPVADELFDLMQQQMQTLREFSPQLRKYLQSVEQKAKSLSSLANPAAIRAFYFTLNLPSFHPLAGNQSLAILLEPQFAVDLGDEIGLDMALRHAVTLSQTITPEIFSQRIKTLRMALNVSKFTNIQPELYQLIEQLVDQLPDVRTERHVLQTWWQTHGITWTNQLRSHLLIHRQLGYDWQINQRESEYIQQYWQVCQLIHDCLNCAVNISVVKRQEVMDSLFAV